MIVTVREFAEKNQLKVFTEGDMDRAIGGCYIGDLLSLVMSKAEEGQIWITIQGNVNIAAVAALADLACVLVAEGRPIDAETKLKATEQGITILGSEDSAYEVACLLHEQLL